jgi:transcriptional regulator with XRE-family HTH domain
MTLKQQIAQQIGQKMKTFREKEGLTQNGLAKKLSTTRQYISMVEKGDQFISLDQLEKFATVLGCKVTIIIEAET